MSTTYRQSSSNDKTLELITLGGRAILVDGRRVEIGVKPELLLIYLTFARGKVRRDELVRLLWPLTDKPKARHSLSQALTALRRIVSIHSQHDTIELKTVVTSDYDSVLNLLAVDRTDNVVGSLKGPFLDGSFIQGSNDFEDWRHTLCVKFNSAVAAWFAAWLEIAIVKSEWQRISSVTHDVSALFGLDLKHLVESEGIRRRIQQHAEPIPRPWLMSNGSLPFVGRDAEIRTLLDAHRQVLGGIPVHVRIAGEAGIGKTRLTSTFLDRISSPTSLILRGRCYESDHSSGLRPLTNALRNTPCETALNQLADPWRSILTALVSAGGGRGNEQLAPNPERQNFVFEAFARLFEQISGENPLVLFLDDIQWAGPSLIELLNHLARGHRGSKFMVITAGRTMAQSTIEYRSNPDYAINLGKFGESDVRSLAKEITALTSCADLAMQLYQRTSGHPYLLNEVARTIHT